MGCVNTSPNKPLQNNNQPQELQIQDSLKVKALDSKHSHMTNGNMQTHQSLPEDYYIEILSASKKKNQNDCKSKHNDLIKQQQDLIVQQNKVDQNVRNINNIQIQSQKVVQESQKQPYSFNQQSQRSKKIRQFKLNNMKKHKQSSLWKQETKKNINKEQISSAGLNMQDNKTKRQQKQQSELQTHQSSIQLSYRQNMHRNKRPGFRSPRGRSCNLFKTFEDDYIQELEALQIKRRQSRSMNNINQ